MPLRKQHLAVTQFGFPLLAPVGAQPTRHHHADEANQPEMNLSVLLHFAFRQRFIRSARQSSDPSWWRGAREQNTQEAPRQPIMMRSRCTSTDPSSALQTAIFLSSASAPRHHTNRLATQSPQRPSLAR